MKHILLSGATGLIGRYLLRDLLATDNAVACLIRSSAREAGRQRLDRMVDQWERQLGRKLPKPHLLSGDLRQPGLGLSSDDRTWVKTHCRAVLNSAGNVTFHSNGEDGEPWRTNVDGVRNLVQLCRETGIDTFHHLSTAYVCGDRKGVILEADGDLGQGFDTDYERSKLHAEQELRESGFRRLDFFRPVSVTGDSATGYTTTYHGVYLFAQFTHLARRRAGAATGESWHHPVRLFQTGDERHHFVPVDAVSRAILELIGRSDLEGRTYHLSPISPCTTATLEEALSTYFGYHGVRFVAPDSQTETPLNETEKLFYELMSGARHRYLADDPVFDCANTRRFLPWWSEVAVDRDYLSRIIRFAVEREFGKRDMPC